MDDELDPTPPIPDTPCIESVIPPPPGGSNLGCCTLPDGTTNMMTEEDCKAAGGTFAGKGIPCTIPIGITGKGNLLYVSTLKGLAACLQAYGTDGSDGAPQWFSENGTTLTGDGVKIRWFELDPFSEKTDDLGTHLTAGWAMSEYPDNSLYRVTGLPMLPVWTKQLTLAQANTLAGNPASVFGTGSMALSYNFAVSDLKKGFIALQLSYNTGASLTWSGVVLPNHGAISFLVYSDDYGATFQCDSTKFVVYPGIQVANSIYDSTWVQASRHVVDSYILAGSTQFAPVGDQTNIAYASPEITFMRVPGSRGGTAPDFSSGMSSGHDSVGDSYDKIFIPYTDKSKKVYADDNKAYIYGTGSGLDAILQYTATFNPLWSAGYTPPTSTHVGDVSMPAISKLLCNALNEGYAVAIDAANIWFCKVLADSFPSWSRVHSGSSVPVGSHAFSPTDSFCVAADKNLAFFTGIDVSGSRKALVCFTPDFGATFVDISLAGSASGIDTVMSLATGDMNYSQIRLDSHYTGNPITSVTGDGADVSGGGQGTINWATAFAAGLKFAFIKATEGSSFTDSRFATNWADALAAGINRGAYHFFSNSVDPVAQANHFVAVATSGGELGYVVDLEEESAIAPATVKSFLDRMETLTGKKTIIYTSPGWWNKYIGFQGWAKDYPLWVAHWNVAVPTLPDGWTEWAYWQYSDQGKGSTYGAASTFIDLDKAHA